MRTPSRACRLEGERDVDDDIDRPSRAHVIGFNGCSSVGTDSLTVVWMRIAREMTV
jgi:hypothetical protein